MKNIVIKSLKLKFLKLLSDNYLTKCLLKLNREWANKGVKIWKYMKPSKSAGA